jgi:hypothetical protein
MSFPDFLYLRDCLVLVQLQCDHCHICGQMVVEQSETPVVPYFASAKIASFKMVGSGRDAGKAVLQMYTVSGRLGSVEAQN